MHGHLVREVEAHPSEMVAEPDGRLQFRCRVERLRDLLLAMFGLVWVHLRIMEGDVAVVREPVTVVARRPWIYAADDLIALALRDGRKAGDKPSISENRRLASPMNVAASWWSETCCRNSDSRRPSEADQSRPTRVSPRSNAASRYSSFRAP